MTVFCDLDGTLIDSARRHTELLRTLLKQESIAYDENELEKYLDFKRDGGTTQSFLECKLSISKEMSADIAKQWVIHIEDDYWLQLDTLFWDSIPILDWFARQEYRIVYVSARQSEAGLLKSLQRLNIEKYAQAIHVVSPKNAVMGKIAAIQESCAPGDFVLGDTEVDAACAEALGLRAKLLHRGFRSERFWQERYTESYKDLKACFNDEGL